MHSGISAGQIAHKSPLIHPPESGRIKSHPGILTVLCENVNVYSGWHWWRFTRTQVEKSTLIEKRRCRGVIVKSISWFGLYMISMGTCWTNRDPVDYYYYTITTTDLMLSFLLPESSHYVAILTSMKHVFEITRKLHWDLKGTGLVLKYKGYTLLHFHRTDWISQHHLDCSPNFLHRKENKQDKYETWRVKD